MSHRFTFTVDVEMDREEGKFASRDEMSEAIQEALDMAEMSDFTGSEGGTYSVSWNVSEGTPPPLPRRRRR